MDWEAEDCVVRDRVIRGIGLLEDWVIRDWVLIE